MNYEQIVRPIYDGYNPVLEKNEIANSLVKDINQNELNELNEMKKRYDVLLDKYTKMQSKMSGSIENVIKREQSIYLGKNVRFTDDVIAYVTMQGVIKKYPNRDIFDGTYGKNGCPKEIVDANIPWSDVSKINLLVGNDMKMGESCGNEGMNVYAMYLNNNPTSEYIGCYNDNETNRTMTLNPEDIGYTTYEKCQQYAANNSYSYFGLQNVRSDNTATCYVSNDIGVIKSYGDGTNKTSSLAIWSSKTNGSGATMCYITNDGRVILKDSSDKTVWQSSNGVENCVNGGNINIDTLTATYGGNCNRQKKYKVNPGNVTNKVKDMLKKNQQNPISITNSVFGDPAGGCRKGWDTAYQCGTAWKTTHIDYAEGQNFIYDCSSEVKACTFQLMVQSDGNVSLYQNNTSIWSTSTNGKQQTINPNWIASKGKFGRNYMKTTEFLGIGEWIGSDDGSIKLVMQKDGNLVLYTSTTTSGCKRMSNGNMYGDKLVNAVYKINQSGNRNTLGKMGYVNEQGELKEYSESMIGFVNDYQIYPNTDSLNNTLESIIATDESACQEKCNTNDECAGYVYQKSTNTCWLKNKNMYPKGEKSYNKNTIMGIRKKESTSCNKNVVNIDTIQYDNYTKFSGDLSCDIPTFSESEKIEYEKVNEELYRLGEDIINKMNDLYNRNNNISNTINMNDEKFKKDLEEYNLINLRIKKLNNIEGMRNLTNSNNLNGMIKDSDLRVLQSNYSYTLWSMLAVGLLTITVNTMSKIK
jgi:hypothetical protein